MAMKGMCTRREAEKFIKLGYVTVDGRAAISGEMIKEDKVCRLRVLLMFGFLSCIHLKRELAVGQACK